LGRSPQSPFGGLWGLAVGMLSRLAIFVTKDVDGLVVTCTREYISPADINMYAIISIYSEIYSDIPSILRNICRYIGVASRLLRNICRYVGAASRLICKILYRDYYAKFFWQVITTLSSQNLANQALTLLEGDGALRRLSTLKEKNMGNTYSLCFEI
jgi:hypothetical protein